MKQPLRFFVSILFLLSVTVAIAAQQDAAQQKSAEEQKTAEEQKSGSQKEQPGGEQKTEPPAESTAAVQGKPLPAGEGRDLVSMTCSQCHDIGKVTQHRETEARWRQYLDEMAIHGAKLEPPDAKIILQYLTKNLGPVPAPASAPVEAAGFQLPAGDGKDLVQGKCALCHDVERVSRTFRDEQGWIDVVDSMVSRGAPIAPDEAKKISAYLFEHYGIH